MARLRFRPARGQVQLGDVGYTSAMLDFGPSSVDGWLADLVAAELGLGADLVVDADAGELRIEGERVALTPLELGVFDQLHRNEGAVVNRRTLLREVWGSDYEGGSNIVDSVVRSLRKSSAVGPRRSRRCGASATGSGAPEPRTATDGQWAGAGSPAASALTASVVRT